MVLDYAALAALSAVVREGSFERAATVLHVTPSAVSQRVRHLEERMGCALVVRSQPCTATEAGQRLCQHLDRVRLLELELHGGLPALARQAPEARVALPLAVNADSLATWFAPALAQWAAQAPVLVQVAVDDQDHTAQALRSGAVLAAVTSHPEPPAGCNSLPLGAMRYLAVASPGFVAQHFAAGRGRRPRVDADSLARAPALVFNTKDALQDRWVQALCGQAVLLPRHSLPSAEAFVTAAEAGMGWGQVPEVMVPEQLAQGRLVPLVPRTPLDVPLYWQHARVASSWLSGLTSAVLAAGRSALRPL